jgi:hypothetical protein
MANFISSKLSFTCKFEKSDAEDVSAALANGKAYISLKHQDSSIAIYVYPTDCYKGSIEISSNKQELIVKGDFSAKCKISPSKFKEITSSANSIWTTDGVTIPGMCVPINGDGDIELEVPVVLTDKK